MDVKTLQEKLIALGYDVGKTGADGIMGKNTRSAVTKFQADAGIVGDFGSLTTDALDKRAAALGGAGGAPMKTSDLGRALIATREGARLKAYRDGGGVLTIGVGHTSAAGPPKVTEGLTITAAECDEILSRDLAKTEEQVRGSIKVKLNQNEFDALMSLALNIGGGAFAGSSVVKRLNAGDRAGAAAAILMWDKDNGKTVPGLTTRRRAERDQFLKL